MSRRTSASSITIEISAQQAEQIEALHEHLPVVSRHMVARAALVIGLFALAKEPEKMSSVVVALRRGPKVATTA